MSMGERGPSLDQLHAGSRSDPKSFYVSDTAEEAELKRAAMQAERDRIKAQRAEAEMWKHTSEKIDEVVAHQQQVEQEKREAQMLEQEKDVQIQLTPLSLVDAVQTCTADARVVHDKKTDEIKVDVSLRDGVELATKEIFIPLTSLQQQKFVLGGGHDNATEVSDVYLSHEQLRLSRRTVPVGSDEDVTGLGTAIDITHCGKNFSYILPAEDAASSKSSSKRFNEDDLVRNVLPHHLALDPRLVVLRKNGRAITSLRNGDIVWLIKDRYPYRFSVFNHKLQKFSTPVELNQK